MEEVVVVAESCVATRVNVFTGRVIYHELGLLFAVLLLLILELLLVLLLPVLLFLTTACFKNALVLALLFGVEIVKLLRLMRILAGGATKEEAEGNGVMLSVLSLRLHSLCVLLRLLSPCILSTPLLTTITLLVVFFALFFLLVVIEIVLLM